MEKFDFSGWATRNDLKCSDGRTIRRDSFKDCDGKTVPLVWNHSHNEPENVLGHALLQNRPEGTYCWGVFNDTTTGQVAKTLVEHGDIRALSIYANELKQIGSDVIHGQIREVSLVHAGANPGAFIDTIIAHSADADEEAIIYTGEPLSLSHSEDISEEKETQKEELLHAEETAKPDEKKQKGDNTDMADSEKTVQDVIDTMNEDQKTVLYAMVAEALQNGGNNEEEDDEEMKHNVFENDTQDNTLIHDGLNCVLADAKRYGSLHESYLAHAAEYGIENIEYLQPDDTELNPVPPFINTNPIGWVSVVMRGVHNTPFDKVRMTFADITEDEARAKGYVKGNYKKEEVFKLLKRSVGPTTIYKKQKFDKEDLLDADFDVVPWIKKEMDLKLDEEKARAYLFGDGRSAADDDKVNESCIIPVIKDADLYAIKTTVTPASGESLEHALISASVLSQDDYQGSGNTTAFLEAKQVSRMLLMEDQFGHRLYKDVKELAAAMGVGEVVKVPSSIIPNGYYGVILDLSDYNVGMKNGGKKNFFDQFDIDFNQNKYLLETRQSAALTRPYSAIVLKAAQE